MPKLTAVNLTTSRVERWRFEPGEGGAVRPQYLWDRQVPGLGVQMLPTGRKAWVLRYRLAGRAKRLTLAPVGTLDLEAARAMARDYLGLAFQGTDPAAERRKPPEPGPLTVADLVSRYTATAHHQSCSPDFRANFASTARRYILPALGDKPLAEVSRADVRTLVESLTDQGKEGMAQGLLTHCRVLFNFAIEQELIEHSPADRVKVRRTTSGRREQWLQTPEELSSAWWIRAPTQVRGLVRWCLLTGCRRDEARLATWDQFSTEPDGSIVWSVAATKSGRPLTLPVTGAMQAVLDEMRQSFPGSAHVFVSTTSILKPVPRGSADWVLRSVPWSWHVLRHSVESHMAELGVGAEVRDLILNHAQRGVGERYRHGRQLDQKRAGLQAWHDYLLSAVYKPRQ